MNSLMRLTKCTRLKIKKRKLRNPDIREERKKREFLDMVLYQAISETTEKVPDEEPSTIEEALNGKNREEWKKSDGGAQFATAE